MGNTFVFLNMLDIFRRFLEQIEDNHLVYVTQAFVPLLEVWDNLLFLESHTVWSVLVQDHSMFRQRLDILYWLVVSNIFFLGITIFLPSPVRISKFTSPAKPWSCIGSLQLGRPFVYEFVEHLHIILTSSLHHLTSYDQHVIVVFYMPCLKLLMKPQ